MSPTSSVRGIPAGSLQIRELGVRHHPAPQTPISLRLDRDLSWPISVRVSGPRSAAGIIKRDLNRYYECVGLALERLAFSRAEAELLVDALQSPPKQARSGRVLAAELEDWATWRVCSEDPRRESFVALLAKIEAIGPVEACAVLDGVEVFWAQRHALYDLDEAAVVEWAFETSGLTHETDRKRSWPIARIVFGLPEDDEGLER